MSLPRKNERELFGQLLKEVYIDMGNGLIWWKKNGRNRNRLRPIGAKTDRRIRFSYHNYMISYHRLIFYNYHGYLPRVVDHINRDPADNRIINLRAATHQQNCFNRGLYKSNTSGITGVTWNKKDKRWAVQIVFNGKGIYLGLYIDKNDAINARKEAEIKYYKEFTPTTQPHMRPVGA